MPGTETRFAVLLFTDIVGSTELKARHGVPAYSAALQQHNEHFKRLARECLNPRTLQSRGDGFFAEAGSVAEAVRFALLWQEAMRDEPWDEVRLAARIGIHAGEVSAHRADDVTWIVAPAADLASRVTDLAVGGQILLTRIPFDNARPFVREHPPVPGKTMPPLRWLAHGPYLMKGCDEPMEIFEVGAEGLAPLTAPPDSEKAKRAIRPGEEETLGWRPATGMEIPGRPGWHLTDKLGAGGFGEVWVGEHTTFHRRRAFKFCFDNERLRALKREVTLVSLLRSALGERDDIVRIHELKLDAPPFYLESDLAPHGNLLQWAERQGGLDKIPLAQRIALVAHTATALAAAHSVGVLHKDIKPTNILIFDGPGGEPRPRLVDFGIGRLTDTDILKAHDISDPTGTLMDLGPRSSTQIYSPPEYLAGKPFTIQGDVFGLGVLLYQLVTVKPLEPLAHGWERDIPDPLLRDDIAACADGDPTHRLASAANLAERLFHLDERRAALREKERLTHEAAAHAAAEASAAAARTRAARLRKLAAVFAFLALVALAGGVLAWRSQQTASNALAVAQERKTEVEQKNLELIEKGAEVDRKNEEYRAMLREAARSDRLVADEKLRAGAVREAFAHLGRAGSYDPVSSLAAEKVAVALNVWPHPLPTAILVGHTEAVGSAEFSPDGKRIVTASADKTARVWDAATGKCLAVLDQHQDVVKSAKFSPDGKRIATASADKTARVWDAASGQALASLVGHQAAVESAEFSPDGQRIVTASADGTARVWEAATGKSLTLPLVHKDAVKSAHFSPDGKSIATASGDHTAEIWNATTGKSVGVLAEHQDSVESVQFSSDGARLVTTSRVGSSRVDLQACKLEYSIVSPK